MWSRTLRTLAAVLVPAACLPVDRVDLPEMVEIDDFEDGDILAEQQSGFGGWWGVTWSDPPTPQPEADSGIASPGFASDKSFFVAFRVERFPKVDFAGVTLGVNAVGTRDLTGFRSLSFTAKFEPADPPPPTGTRLLCELSCPTAFAGFPDSALPFISYYNQGNAKYGFELTGDWSSYTLQLTGFEEPVWQGSAVEPETCLGLVEELQFVVVPDLLDGEAAVGKLFVDDVYLG